MKTAVLYYTLSGSTKNEAERIAKELSADIFEIKELKKRTMFSAFLPGCPNAMSRKASKILPIEAELSDYDKFVLCCPVWASFPAPAFNAMLELIPKGKAVDAVLCSSGGDTSKSKEDTIVFIKSKGLVLSGYTDIKTFSEKPGNAE